MASVVFPADDCDPVAIARLLRAARVVVRPPVTVRRTRLDTFDGRLYAAGLRLELRTTTVGTARTSQLVLGGRDGAPAQLPLAPVPAHDAPLDPTTLPAGPLRQRLTTAADGRALLAQVTVTSSRQTGERRSDEGAPRLRVHLDADIHVDAAVGPVAGIHGDPGAPAPTAAIEVETLPGGEQATATLGRKLERAGLTRRKGDALEFAADAVGVDRCGWSGLAAVDLDRGAPAVIGFRVALRACADALQANLDGTVHAVDPEFLHDLRISVRRIRSLLGEGRKVLPADVRRDLREGFAWLGALTGDARDLDVHVTGWAALTDQVADDRDALAPVLAQLDGDRAAAHAQVARDLRSPRAVDVLARARAWLDLPDTEVAAGKHGGRPLGRIAAERIRTAHRSLVDDGRGISAASPPAELHRLRKDAKRLRYLLESFGSLGGGKRQREVVRHLKRLQDNLGAFQDATVQADRLHHTLRELAVDGPVAPSTQAAADRLAASIADRQQAAREAFAARFSAYDRPAAHRTMDALLDRMTR